MSNELQLGEARSDEVEGHMPRVRNGLRPQDDEVEGHMPRVGRGAVADDDEDTEGHAMRGK